LEQYFTSGGFHVQINIIDQDLLVDASEHPENYPNLMVRVAGYSDYFVMLPPEIQNEVMKRLEHDDL